MPLQLSLDKTSLIFNPSKQKWIFKFGFSFALFKPILHPLRICLMERKVRITEKISSILTINIKIELIFFLRKNYCSTLSLVV
ncbi:hypothetical protein A6J73_13060 [Enterococcus hirae]|nr:hypothetical protein A6J73_13060 [Enterococcus hirae]RYS93051.1 hypothetical protein EAI86_01770 [Enterococcus hirae]